jgi:hypothetical protein
LKSQISAGIFIFPDDSLSHQSSVLLNTSPRTHSCLERFPLFTFSIQIFTFPYSVSPIVLIDSAPLGKNQAHLKEILMRKLFYAFGLTSALVFGLAAQAAAPNFAGTWTLDKSKSQGLSQRLQNVESFSWVITQTDKEITIEDKVTGGQPGGGPGGAAAGAPPAAGAPAAGAPAAGGAPQGGGPGAGGGRGMMGGPRTYNLDGSETSGDMGRAKYTRKATMSSDGKTLELLQKTTFQGPDGEVTTTSSDKLTLSADGKVLTVVRHSESPRGTQDSTLVFNK